MSIKINFLKTKIKPSSNLILFTDEKFRITKLKKYLTNNEFSFVSDLLKSSDLKKSLLVFGLNSKKNLVLVSIKDKLKSADIENLGAEFYSRINHGKNNDYLIISEALKVRKKIFNPFPSWSKQNHIRLRNIKRKKN